MKKIGFIGLGIMGESMCDRIIQVGKFPCSVFDVDPAKVEKLVEKGGIKAESISDIANFATHIILMVPNDESVRSVFNSLLPVVKPGTTIIDMSTISPNTSRELALKVQEKGCTMYDAPVVKSKPAAISGDLGIYVGGDKEGLDDIRPILECMGKNIIHLGENGAGLTMKLCHNSLVAEIQNGVNEMLVLAGHFGISEENFVKAISYGGGQNFYLDGKWKAIKERNFSPAFPFEHMAKDIQLTKNLAETKNLHLPGIEQVNRIYQEGLRDNLGREDFSASYKVVELKSKQ
ncbi:MAG: NAD(P)-dependent oxidoreductase [Leptospiraceae bacterium]|nr:NAD(P)-dependent oxidoreductase [Leptospiraceae bacterium]MCP5503478.1 NAD(P)-dependent oxidoreductase [Leptospiraceae bacterium]